MQWQTYSRSVAVSVLLMAGLLSSPAVAGFELEDLSGTWSVHGLVGGVDPNVPGSFYMTGTANTSGSVAASGYADSRGTTAPSWADDTATLDLSGGGILTVVGDDAPFRGVMNWDEDFVVNVGTITPGPDAGVTGPGLWTWVKESSSPGFAQGDGAGTWWMHGFYTGEDWATWSRSQIAIDAAGNVSFVAGTFETSEDDANMPPDGTATITSHGYVGFSYDPKHARHHEPRKGHDCLHHARSRRGLAQHSIRNARG